VFDRSQVDELPPPAEPAPLDPPAAAEIDGDELAPWLEPLTALAAEIGSSVTFEPIASGADGYYRPKTKAIIVGEGWQRWARVRASAARPYAAGPSRRTAPALSWRNAPGHESPRADERGWWATRQNPPTSV
jgi:hypothetical protein